MNLNKPSKIIVAMSGGVDSSVAALLLKQQGYEVEGLFMKNWEEDDTENFCSAAEDIKDAQQVCDKLNIKLHKVNFAAEYWDNVFADFLKEYEQGRTPNPDIGCNREIKFKALLDHAIALGASHLATGHYARIRANNTYELLTGLDNNKDQSYCLYTLQQAQLSKALFPIGELEKPLVRALAEQHGLITHNKKDSTGICFIGEKRFKQFLQQYIPAKPGLIVDEYGDVLGEHDGVMYYTLGQRQGLRIGGKKNHAEKPWYVATKDVEQNKLIVVQGHDHPLLFAKTAIISNLSWVAGHAPVNQTNLQAKVRYRTSASPCSISLLSNGDFLTQFQPAEWAVTPGQSIVFYQNEVCLGGGVIISAAT